MDQTSSRAIVERYGALSLKCPRRAGRRLVRTGSTTVRSKQLCLLFAALGLESSGQSQGSVFAPATNNRGWLGAEILSVTSSESETAISAAPGRPDTRTKAYGQALGLHIRALAPSEAHPLGVQFGLLIERIDDPAPAHQLAPGDVIVGVNNERIGSVQEFNAAIAKYSPGSSVACRSRLKRKTEVADLCR